MTFKYKSICVYCSSSDAVPHEYVAAAEALGKGIGERGLTLGIIPDSIHSRGLVFEGCTGVKVTHDMASRKLAMEEAADAFIALPGGFGTLEEITQAITLKQLQYHTKPIVLVNTHGFYDKLLDFLEHTYELKFAKATYRELYHVAANAEQVFKYLDQYEPPQLESKWFEK